MTMIDDGELCLSIRGATDDQVKRGLSAAKAVFAEAGCSAYDAFLAYFNREGFDAIDDFEAITDEMSHNGNALLEAQLAAARAAGVDPRAQRHSLSLSGVEQQLHDTPVIVPLG